MTTNEYFEQKAINTPWAFTVKKLGLGEVLVTDYISVMDVFRKFGYVDCHHYERDSLGKLHIHGIVLLRKGFLRKRLCVNGFHLKLVEIYNRAGWELYINKHNYLFDQKYEPKTQAKEEIIIPLNDFGGDSFKGIA